jgi:hypothetical protein
VSRRLAVLAEVVGSGDEAAAEVVLPEAVHQHAGGERMVGARDPAGERQSSAAAPWWGGRGEPEGCGGGIAQGGGEAGLDQWAGRVRVAAQEDVGARDG